MAVAILFCTQYAGGQEHRLYFDSFKVKDGLPDNSVVSLTQDSGGYVWAVTRHGLSRYDGVSFKNFKHDDSDEGSISSDESLGSVITDRLGRIWVTSNGLELYHPENESFQKIPVVVPGLKTIYFDSRNRLYLGGIGCLKYLEGKNLQTSGIIDLGLDKNTLVRVICEDDQHNLLVGTTKGLFKINFLRQRPNSPAKAVLVNRLDISDITTVAQDKHHNLWIGTRTNGLYHYDYKTGIFSPFTKDSSPDKTLIGSHIRKIIVAKNGTLWIGTQEGLSILNIDKQRFYNFQYDPADQHSLSQNSIYDIFQDKAGSIWIGTYFGGLNVVHPEGAPFTVFQNNAYKNSISSNIISTITQDAHHNLWIGTEAGGVNFWDKQTGRFTVFRNNVADKTSLSSNLVKAIAIDQQGDVYIGTSTGGLNIYHPSDGRFENFWYSRQKTIPGVSGDDVRCLLITHQNEVLVGTSTGVKIFLKNERRFIAVNANNTEQLWVNTLFEDKDHTIWAGTSNGLYQMTKGGQMKRMDFFDSATQHRPLAFNINCMQQDNLGRLWVGTYYKGLLLLDQPKHSFHAITTREGLAGNNVLGILADTHNNLWISTNDGLSKFDVLHGRFQNLKTEDGLPDNQFNKGSYYKQNDSTFYFGTYNGLINFNPAMITQNQAPPKVVFSSIKLFNQPLKIKQQHELLKGDLSYERELTFKYNQNVFTVGFAALNFIKSSKNRYAYRLTGFDHDWNYVDQPAATYTNLAAGDYQLQVKAANNDGVWNQQPAVLYIHVLPAPWKTWWAYVIYLIIAVIIMAYIRRFLRARMQLRQELFRERIEAEQEKKSHQRQLDFFTDISHEIRTPLTLILGPAERLAAIKIDNKNARQYIDSIENNANRLYKLVTELLDFRKAGANQLHLYPTEEDLIKFLKEIFCAFQSSAEIKDINFQFNAQAIPLTVCFDRDQLEKVFNNLFINALKFTPAGGSIKVSVHENTTDNQVEVVVEDNGKGIRPEDIDRIFDTFYQAESSAGTGIGLALSKRLVELHEGTISVLSKAAIDGQGGFTAFTVKLPLGKEHITNDQVVLNDSLPQHDFTFLGSEPNEEPAEEEALPSSQRAGNRSILLVEDNDEVREFIRQSLENDYQVIEAKNGQEGLSYATRLIPDLIISDVMMPVMDGLELCSRIKADIRTSHIPVILLTAKAAPVHHIHGLQHGADAYITKPFSTQALHLNIHNMLTLISAQQRKYSERLSLPPLPLHHQESEDEKLLYKLQEIIQNNIDNPELDLTTLTRELGMSKSVLYKKFSALTNQSLNNFIKTERLKKAVKLFKEGETSVIAAAVKVGFNDVKYFSKEFKKLYNVTPNEYLNGGSE
ncbi:signal transduction histidine kinase [Mucilaginibacter yixingensis]|uniref:histidine kinase n=1 Tax=Mucilaginibacter yixingensis TaxID=1295612 RepID=A0A2T5J651_9SPHI|nr:two-component regulator propeller domain-containing protein [Mucilaginibacter yixingensis]PTQ93969.1 signal transduction histidine kinase [Mucilaginibacter yixingensis]